MKYYSGTWWVWAAGALVWAAVASAKFQESDYENTLMEDPLQPVWDRLDGLSGEITSAFEAKMKVYVEQMKRDMEGKFTSLMSQLELKTSAINNNIMNNLGNVFNKMAQVNTNMTSWIENFYGEHMRVDADEAVRKVEQHVDVKVSAVENRLIEHVSSTLGAMTVVRAGSGGNATAAGGGAAGGGGSGSSIAAEGPSVVASIASTAAMETRIVTRISSELSSLQSAVTEQLTSLSGSLSTKSDSALATFNAHFRKINELLTGTEEDVDHTSTCATLVDKISELMNAPPAAGAGREASCSGGLSEETASQLTTALGQIQGSTAFLPRDCSDQHWYQPQAPTGVYQTYPTLDPKAPVTVWCQMGTDGAKESGGWTVILRRQNTSWGLVDFNRTWSEYSVGFGVPGEGEWWYGLASLHALTYRQPYEVQILMKDIELGSFHAQYTTFRVEDETKDYRLIVEGFSGNVSVDALSSKHHGSSFSTGDRDNDDWEGGNCAVSNSGGWWFNACHYTTLTAPFPTTTNRSAKTIRWVTEEQNGYWLVLDDVTVQIRPSNYALRFQVQAVDG